jgi:hypothetical protein
MGLAGAEANLSCANKLLVQTKAKTANKTCFIQLLTFALRGGKRRSAGAGKHGAALERSELR